MHSLFWLSLVVCQSCVAANGVMHFSCVASAAHFFIYKGENIMPDYKAMYLNLFNSVTEAVKILSDAQKRAEEIYIDSSELDEERIKNFKIITKEKQ